MGLVIRNSAAAAKSITLSPVSRELRQAPVIIGDDKCYQLTPQQSSMQAM